MARASRTVACAALLAAIGCSLPDSAGAGVSDTTFVRTMVALRKLELDRTVDSTALDSARRVVLRRNRVTVGELEAKARALAGDAQHASNVWRAIDRGVEGVTLRSPTKP